MPRGVRAKFLSIQGRMAAPQHDSGYYGCTNGQMGEAASSNLEGFLRFVTWDQGLTQGLTAACGPVATICPNPATRSAE